MYNRNQNQHYNRPNKQQNRRKPMPQPLRIAANFVAKFTGNSQDVSSQTTPSLFVAEKKSIYEFKHLKMVGSGAFASVYKAFEPMIPNSPVNSYREVALKRINLDEIQDQSVYQTTLNEVNLFKSLEHENIVRCYYSFKETSPHSNRNYLVLVLEYINGGDLEKWLEGYIPLRVLVPEKDIWSKFRQIAKAVDYIHSKRIIHRDLKPPNILLTSQGVVKLADFGLSRLFKATEIGDGVAAKTVCGTPYYMSPERINELPYTFESDIWSLGCILYEMATLKSPFFGEKDNIGSLVQKIGDADFPPLPEDCYTQQLEQLMLICMDPDTAKRPSASQVCQVAEHMHAHWTRYYNRSNPYAQAHGNNQRGGAGTSTNR